MNNYFSLDHPVGKFLADWRRNLEDNRADRASLRRCKTLQEVELTSVFQYAYWQLIKLFDDPKRVSKEQCAIIIALAARVSLPGNASNSGGEPFGHQIAQGEKPKLHELRFRRLLRVENRQRLYEVLVKIIRQMEGEVNLLDILSAAFYWGDSERKRLAYQYYEKANLKKGN